MQKNKPILDFFNNNKNSTYEIIFVLDIDFSEYPYYYEVLVKDIHTNYYTTVKIPPELLRYRYKIGNVYKNNKNIGINKNIKRSTLRINTSKELRLIQLKDIIEKEDIDLVEYNYFKNFYLKQYCYLIETNNNQIIIPAYTIANRFYFLSSSMKKAIFKNSLSDLCYDKEFYKKDNTVYLKVKSAAAKKDWPFICRFLDDINAKYNLQYFIYQKSLHDKKNRYGQIKAKFPTNEEFEIDIKYIKLSALNKTKYLVLDIFNDTSSFTFEKICIEKFTTAEGKKIDNINMPSKQCLKKRIPREVNHTIKEGAPSSSYYQNLDGDIGERDRNTQNLKIEIKDIFNINQIDIKKEFTDNKVFPSFEESNSSGSDDLIQTIYSFYGDSTENVIHIFNIYNFYILFELLSQELGVDAINISNLININVKENSKKNKSIKYYLQNEQPRKYLYANFYYADKNIFIIEIELDSNWSALSTWFFITEDKEFKIDNEICQDIISYYIGECKTYKDLEEFIMNKYKLKFYKKAHIKKFDEEELLDHWIDDILKTIKQEY